MTDADIKQLIERLRQRSNSRHMLLTDPPKPAPDADCHAAADMLEQHEATKRENEQLRAALLEIRDCTTEHGGAAKALKIINAALEARGLEIKEKAQ
jgi:hypothetical protein